MVYKKQRVKALKKIRRKRAFNSHQDQNGVLTEGTTALQTTDYNISAINDDVTMLLESLIRVPTFKKGMEGGGGTSSKFIISILQEFNWQKDKQFFPVESDLGQIWRPKEPAISFAVPLEGQKTISIQRSISAL